MNLPTGKGPTSRLRRLFSCPRHLSRSSFRTVFEWILCTANRAANGQAVALERQKWRLLANKVQHASIVPADTESCASPRHGLDRLLPPERPRSKPLPQLTGKKSGNCAVLGVLRRVQTFDFHGFATNLAILATRNIRELTGKVLLVSCESGRTTVLHRSRNLVFWSTSMRELRLGLTRKKWAGSPGTPGNQMKLSTLLTSLARLFA